MNSQVGSSFPIQGRWSSALSLGTGSDSAFEHFHEVFAENTASYSAVHAGYSNMIKSVALPTATLISTKQRGLSRSEVYNMD